MMQKKLTHDKQDAENPTWTKHDVDNAVSLKDLPDSLQNKFRNQTRLKSNPTKQTQPLSKY